MQEVSSLLNIACNLFLEIDFHLKNYKISRIVLGAKKAAPPPEGTFSSIQFCRSN